MNNLIKLEQIYCRCVLSVKVQQLNQSNFLFVPLTLFFKRKNINIPSTANKIPQKTNRNISNPSFSLQFM